ncbi:MAG: restriction endonuclease subunit R [bacterium]
MRDKLLFFIKSLKDNNQITGYDEAAVKQAIIMPILQILGWDVFNVNEVKPEHSTGGGNVDFALMEDGENKLFLEVKNTGIELEKQKDQLLNYSYKVGIPLAILTNGIVWWFYLPSLKIPWEKRMFCTIDIIQQDAEYITDRFVDFLSKENVHNGTAEKKAEEAHRRLQIQDKISATIQEVWDNLTSEPYESLIALISDKVKKMCGDEPEHSKIIQFLQDYFTSKSETDKRRKPNKQVGVSSTQQYGKKSPKKPIFGFYFKGKPYEVRTWKGMLVKLCEILFSIHHREFVDKVLNMMPQHFTKTRNELREPREITNARIWIETNLSAEATEKRCRELLELFGHSKNDLRIKTN